MEIICGIGSLTRSLSHPVLTIGNFDGVHLGHREIIRIAVQKARDRKGTAVAFTFRPHPQVALKPGAQVNLLTSYDEKLELLEKCGLDVVIEEPFSREFSTIRPNEFFTDLLLKRIGMESVVVGYDFAFGNERSGHLQVLEKLCKDSGVELTIVPPQKIDGRVASSSKVREFLLSGDLEAASHLLGRHFFYRGVVIKGDARGRQIGFPTANIKIDNKLALPFGVYACWARCEKLFPGKKFAAVTNIGVRPTFTSGTSGTADSPLVEAHLIEQEVDLYGNSLEVNFVKKLRAEKKFSGVDALVAQIKEDVVVAKNCLASSEPKP